MKMNKNKSITFLTGIFVAVILMTFVVGSVIAQEDQTTDLNYPERPIRVIIPYAPGGTSDYVVRQLEKVIREQNLLPVPLVLTNIGGASGTIGSEELFRSDPDGYMIMVHQPSLTVAKLLGISDLSWDDFEPVARVCDGVMGVHVKADSQWETFEDLITHAKENPGEQKWSWTPGGTSMLMAQCAILKTGIDVTYVPSEGTAEMLTKILGGHIDVITNSVNGVHAYLDSGDIRTLGINAPSRMTLLPDLPTFLELGYDMGFSQSYAAFAPPGTPKEIIKYLEGVFIKAMETDEWKEAISNAYFVPNAGTANDVIETYSKCDIAIKEVLEVE